MPKEEYENMIKRKFLSSQRSIVARKSSANRTRRIKENNEVKINTLLDSKVLI